MTLIRFAQELHGTLESDRLHQLIARGLSTFLGRREVWVVARFGARQHIILPHGTTASSPKLITDDVRKWMTFPMTVKGEGIGVVGVGLQGGDLSDDEQRLVTVLTRLVAQSLATANSFEIIRQTSLVDSLTGCATRVEGLRRFEAELRRADRAQRSLAVLMLDLDHFKSINDRFGHHTGDAVLSAIGEMLLKTLRASDIRCRWGGEEFLLVLADTTADRARRACEALRHRIATTPVGTSAQPLQITASIGVTMTRPGEWDIQRLVARADLALYRAKSLGRNRVEFDQNDQPGDDAGPSIATAPQPPPPRPVAVESLRWPDRRDPARPDRRRVPSPGRRRTDPGSAAGEQWRA
jgi:diguanylate cyclase (GGDEF)-like protein